MLDVFHIPSNSDNSKIFYAQGSTAWQTWQKPRGAKFIQVFCLGAGGGGGGGRSSAAGGAGGAGGGSGGIVRALIPAFLLPDTLYIQVGTGGTAGQSGATGAGGAVGGISYIFNSCSKRRINSSDKLNWWNWRYDFYWSNQCIFSIDNIYRSCRSCRIGWKWNICDNR
jgi:hypothetical protein